MIKRNEEILIDRGLDKFTFNMNQKLSKGYVTLDWQRSGVYFEEINHLCRFFQECARWSLQPSYKSRENDATHDFGSDDDFKIWGFDKVNYEVQFAVLYSMYAQILPCTIPIMPQSIIQAYRSVHGDPETVLRLHKCYICQSSVKWEASRNRFYYVCSTFIQCCGSGCRI